MNEEIDYTLSLNNKKVFDFYNTNQNVNFETANILLVDFMETIFNKTTNDVNINSQLLAFMKENKKQFTSISNSMNKMNQNVSIITSDVTTQMNNVKTEYINQISQIINTNSLTTNEKISSLIDKGNSILVDKTSIILNDVIPKNNSSLHTHIRESLKELHTNIASETNKLTDNIDNKELHNEIILNIENKLALAIQNIQNPIHSTLTASEERITSNINTIKEHTQNAAVSQNKLFGELEGFLGKYKSSTHKGKFGEEQLASVLNSMYNNAEIINTTGQKAAGDFIIKRPDKPDIMIENKEYNYNIPKEEISKFIRDVEALNVSGIFISQHSGIAFKQNYQIDINNGNVLIYIQHCDYDPEKIRLAVDIIESITHKLSELDISEDDNNISKEDLDSINDDYRLFIAHKGSLHTILRDFTKKMNSQIDELNMPNLDKYLESKYAYVKDRIYYCDLCNDFGGKSKQSLSAHKRACKKKIDSMCADKKE
jgi:hypothetical protein